MINLFIDIHAHVFPNDLASRALSKLTEGGVPYYPVSDGTVSGLLRNMDAWGVDISVIQPVVTKPHQVRTINEWVASICSDRLVCFGGIYPHNPDYKSDIDFVVSLGLKGLKFHAEYQDFIVDDEKMLRIYDYALSRGLILLHHGGFDPGFSPPFRSSAKGFANVARAMRGGVIIAAHLGGHGEWADVEEHLAGSSIYLDTSMGFEYFPHDIFLKLLKKHGADKILFGSDSPWSNARTEIEHINSLPIPKSDIDLILSGNAKRLLHI